MHVRNKAIGLAVCFLSFVFAGSAHGQAAQATTQSFERATTGLTGGKIEKQSFKVSGQAVKAFTIRSGSQTTEVKAGDRIEGLTLEGATISRANAQGGKLEVSPTMPVDTQRATVTPPKLTGTKLKDAFLTDLKLPAASQKFKLRGTDVTTVVTVANPQELQLDKVETESVNVDNPVVPFTALQKETPLGVTTQVDGGLVGDYIILNVNVDRFIVSDTDGPAHTAPAGTCFRVSQEFEKADPADSTKKQKYVRGTFITGFMPRLPSLMPPWKCPSGVGGIDVRQSYDVARQLIAEDRDRSRFGYTYGVLVAPFKYYRADRQFSAGASVGPYLGHRIHDRQGSSTVAAVSIGAASATVKTQNPDGTETTSTKTGLTIALAALSQFKDFNAGLIMGRDFFSKADNIPINGRVWFSVSFGKKLD